MNKKAQLYSGAFALFGAVIFIFSLFYNRTYFEAIAYDNIISYQFRQLFSIILLYIIGYCFIYFLKSSLSPIWTALLAFPTGICVWVFPSLILLLIGIPYTFSMTMLIIVLLLGGLFVLYRKHRTFSSTFFQSSIPVFLIILGAAFWVSSGLIYVFVSYDSYFYFTNYGNTLTIIKNFKDIVGENSFTLTNISQFLPLLNSYTAFWGLDQCFQMQAFLMFHVAACFAYGLYQYCLQPINKKHSPLLFTKLSDKKRALLYSALFTLLLVTSTSFIVVSAWVLANMYCMAYMFFSMLLLENVFSSAKKEAYILSAIFFTALTLLRKDGIIFVCFLLLYFIIKTTWSKKTLFFIFLPSIIFELWWLFYVRVVLKATVEQAAFTSIANNKNVAFVIAAISTTCIYLFILHPIFEKKFPFSETWIIYTGMLLLLFALTIHDWNQIIDNIDMTIRNMFLYPASWGISGIIFGILLTITLLHKSFWDIDTFLWIGYILLNFISYCAVGKNLWVNWDDSYNRIVLQIIPLFVFISGKKSLDLLQSDKPDHSSES